MLLSPMMASQTPDNAKKKVHLFTMMFFLKRKCIHEKVFWTLYKITSYSLKLSRSRKQGRTKFLIDYRKLEIPWLNAKECPELNTGALKGKEKIQRKCIFS